MKKKQEQTASFMVRFNQQIFEENGESKIQWKGKISHVQDGEEQRFSDFNDALTFMQLKLGELTEEATKHQTSEEQESIIHKSLSMWKTIKDVGLGYITLGQQSTTLSGGEAQRIKLAAELSKRDTGNTFYILDEPTTGLHFEDIRVLMNVLNELADKGNTVLIIEHNLDVVKLADYVIDVGMEGGKNGGKIVVTGTPEEVSKHKKSYTAKFLKKLLF